MNNFAVIFIPFNRMMNLLNFHTDLYSQLYKGRTGMENMHLIKNNLAEDGKSFVNVYKGYIVKVASLLRSNSDDSSPAKPPDHQLVKDVENVIQFERKLAEVNFSLSCIFSIHS
jgi:hypothetical protein